MLTLQYFLTFTLFLFIYSVSALPEPAATRGFQQRHPHQVGFVIPPNAAPPYGKSLPESSSYSRTWSWTQWILDAKTTLKCIFGKPGKHQPRPPIEEEERNMSKFENDIVLRVNVTSLSDRTAITELAEVSECPRRWELIVEYDLGYLVNDSFSR